MQRAEAARELLVLLTVERWSRKAAPGTRSIAPLELTELLVAQVARQVDATHFGAQRWRQRLELEAAERLALLLVPGFDRLFVVEVLVEASSFALGWPSARLKRDR